MARPTIEEILAVDHDWYHTVTLADGVATPGKVDLRPYVAMAGFPDDLSGTRALDVGSFDGFWAFEMERRGATVVAIDADRSPWPDVAEIHRDKLPRHDTLGTGFRLVHRYVDSGVDRRIVAVADLTADAIGGPVDLAFVGAILLHLRDPVGGLERVRHVLTPGGRLVCMEPIDAPLSEGAFATVPTARCLVGESHITWWYPNDACLAAWVEGAGFVDVSQGAKAWYTDTAGGRQLTRTIHAVNPSS